MLTAIYFFIGLTRVPIFTFSKSTGSNEYFLTHWRLDILHDSSSETAVIVVDVSVTASSIGTVEGCLGSIDKKLTHILRFFNK